MGEIKRRRVTSVFVILLVGCKLIGLNRDRGQRQRGACGCSAGSQLSSVASGSSAGSRFVRRELREQQYHKPFHGCHDCVSFARTVSILVSSSLWCKVLRTLYCSGRASVT
jgi:hypothetical protein